MTNRLAKANFSQFLFPLQINPEAIEVEGDPPGKVSEGFQVR